MPPTATPGRASGCLEQPLEPRPFSLHDGLSAALGTWAWRRDSHHKRLEAPGPCQEPRTETAPEKSLGGRRDVLGGFSGISGPDPRTKTAKAVHEPPPHEAPNLGRDGRLWQTTGRRCTSRASSGPHCRGSETASARTCGGPAARGPVPSWEPGTISLPSRRGPGAGRAVRNLPADAWLDLVSPTPQDNGHRGPGSAEGKGGLVACHRLPPPRARPPTPKGGFPGPGNIPARALCPAQQLGQRGCPRTSQAGAPSVRSRGSRHPGPQAGAPGSGHSLSRSWRADSGPSPLWTHLLARGRQAGPTPPERSLLLCQRSADTTCGLCFWTRSVLHPTTVAAAHKA